MAEIKYKSEVIGRGGISARVVAKSVSAYSGQEIVTWEYEAPKCILAEINTHRVFSRNAQSSRAVPVSKVIDQIRNNPVTPIYWGSNQAGMVAGEEIDNEVSGLKFIYEQGNCVAGVKVPKELAWQISAEKVADIMEAWDKAKYHKQIVNRIGEAFTFVRGVITATEIDNFFHLRVHPAADPFMQELARVMWESYELVEADVLYEGDWHLPYVYTERYADGQHYFITQDDGYQFYCTLERAKQISAAACAQVSFRKLDLSDETIDRVYSRLVDEETPHASCVEHQATPIRYTFENVATADSSEWPEGVSHMDRENCFWSGNFKNWVQNRKLIPNESCSNFKLRSKENKNG